MSLKKTQSICLDKKPCSMSCFSQKSGRVLYAVACYEQNAVGDYVGEIVVVDSSSLSIVKHLPATGGVFRIHNYLEEGLFYAVTTNGECLFVDYETLECRVNRRPDSPYFTDARIFGGVIGLTSDSGCAYVMDRTTESELFKVRAHSLKKVGDLDCPAWSCDFLSETEFVTVGDDGMLKLWDMRAKSDTPAAATKGVTDDGIVFVKKQDGWRVATGDYGQYYTCYDVRMLDYAFALDSKYKLPGGVWHVDYNVNDKHRLLAVACMQGGLVVLQNDDVIAQATGSTLTYGVAIHEDGQNFVVAEVEFDDRRLNSYSLTL